MLFPIKKSFLRVFYQQTAIPRNQNVPERALRMSVEINDPLKIIFDAGEKMVGLRTGGFENAARIF